MSPHNQMFLGRTWDYVNVIINIYIERNFLTANSNLENTLAYFNQI
jgi:hypothetical protein